MSLPETGYLRLPQIIGNPKASPPIPAIIPIGRSTWWAGVRSGRYPKPVKLGPKTTAWRVEDIRALAPITKAILETGAVCVVGNEDKIKADSEIFKEIKPLFA